MTRKYHFALPGPAERRAYVANWATTLPEAIRPDEAARDRIAARTEGFSFAYLKELFLSSILIRADEEAARGPADARPIEAILDAQVDALRAQMADVDDLRAQLSELHERVDFTERLLSQEGGGRALPKPSAAADAGAGS